jgi:hypothetical protein
VQTLKVLRFITIRNFDPVPKSRAKSRPILDNKKIHAKSCPTWFVCS